MSILRSTFLILTLTLISISLHANQEEDILIFQPSVRIGFDASGLLNRIWQPEVTNIEFSVDGKFKPDWFIAAEAGYLDIDISRELFDYTSNGLFARAGVDYNVLEKREPESNDVVLLMFRYGYSNLTHNSDRIEIVDPYWGNFNSSVDSENINSHWVELGFALKAELFRGLFLGWSVRGRYLIYSSRDAMLDPYNIPGFGIIRKSNTAYSLHYSIYYRFPF